MLVGTVAVATINSPQTIFDSELYIHMIILSQRLKRRLFGFMGGWASGGKGSFLRSTQLKLGMENSTTIPDPSLENVRTVQQRQ